MVKIGKPECAPGYERVARERQEWEDIKAAYMRDPNFVQVLQDCEEGWTTYITNEYKYTNKWSNKLCKWKKVRTGLEERLYNRIYECKGVEHDLDEREDVIQVDGFSLEERVALQDILRNRMRQFCWHLYLLEKESLDMKLEQDQMAWEDGRKPQKKVRFA